MNRMMKISVEAGAPSKNGSFAFQLSPVVPCVREQKYILNFFSLLGVCVFRLPPAQGTTGDRWSTMTDILITQAMLLWNDGKGSREPDRIPFSALRLSGVGASSAPAGEVVR